MSPACASCRRELLQRFTQDRLRRPLALVAEVFVDGARDGDRRGPLRARPRPAGAEFAVSVAEPWQGKRLASRMLRQAACRAAAAGVRRMVGETLATNEQMLPLARKAGFTVAPSPDARGLMLLERRGAGTGGQRSATQCRGVLPLAA